jgi:flavin reductase (DIM6/NTAB) family NADH-FMN oxidoreductase RutF
MKMSKISYKISNEFCPQTLFMYGTYKADGTPNFGLFSWFSYCWDDEMGVMASIGERKLTIDRIRETKMFSANLVTEKTLPLADYFGSKPGYSADKMDIRVNAAKGSVLNVPVLNDSPWSYELEVSREIRLSGNTVFLCKIRNVLAEEFLLDNTVGVEERFNAMAPVHYAFGNGYFSWNGKLLGRCGELPKKI